MKEYNKKALYYSKHRPSYPKETIEYILKKSKVKDNSSIVDIGAGTGIFTELLFRNNFTVYAVESNKEMFSKLKQLKYSNLNLINSSAEETKLKTKSIDLVVVAQAFHWFDKEKFKKECKRILKESSFVALIWNEVNYKTEIGKQIKKLIEDFTDGNKLYTMDLNENDSLVEKFFDNGFEKKCIDNKLIVTKEQFIGNYLSKSYAPLFDSKRYDEYLKKINKIVDANIKEKVLEIEHKTYIYIGKFKNI